MNKTLLTLALGALTLASAQAAVLTYGTFTGTDPDSSESLGSAGAGGAGFQSAGGLGVAFTVSRSDLSLTQVQFDLSSTGTRRARLRIYSGGFGTGNSGTELFASGEITLSSTAAVTTFTGMNINLVSGQTYWLFIDGVGTSTTGAVQVHSISGNTDSYAQTVSGISPVAGYRTSGLDSGGSSTLVNNGQLPNFTVTVPEPHEYALVAGLGLCAFAAYRRRMTAVKA